MIPKPPPREGSLGFLFLPPYRVQGISIAGEQTCVMIPELDVCFDMGLCPRAALASKYVAISHGHMDHIGGLSYWCSQRNFQGMGEGTIVCSKAIEGPLRNMLESYRELEGTRTPFKIIALDPEESIEIKNSIHMRIFDLEHTCPSSGYAIVEKRSKLLEEYVGMPQDKLKEIKDSGKEITRTFDVPLIAYLSDTAPGPALLRDDVLNAKVVIAECTFAEQEHIGRAEIGKHLHLNHIVEWLNVLKCEKLVLIHLSRRTNIIEARKRLRQMVSREQAERVEFLMDYKTNKMRYEAQAEEVERKERERRRSGPVSR